MSQREAHPVFEVMITPRFWRLGAQKHPLSDWHFFLLSVFSRFAGKRLSIWVSSLLYLSKRCCRFQLNIIVEVVNSLWTWCHLKMIHPLTSLENIHLKISVSLLNPHLYHFICSWSEFSFSIQTKKTISAVCSMKWSILNPITTWWTPLKTKFFDLFNC